MGRTICPEIHTHTYSVWNKEEFPEAWKESMIVPTNNKGDKTDYTNCRGISLLSTTYKILSSILLSRLAPCAKEIIGDCHCGIQHNRSTADHIFCVCQIHEKNGNTVN